MNTEQDNQTASDPAVASSDLLAGWTVEERSWGVGQCFGARGKCLCRGKWAIIGSSGHFRIIRPNGWVEDRPAFDTELEAMAWVMEKSKANSMFSPKSAPQGATGSPVQRVQTRAEPDGQTP